MMVSQSPTIVLIEDNPADVLLVREAIRARGLAVDLTVYPDVPEAIAGLCEGGNALPQAILLDLNLPKGEGMTVLKFLRGSERLGEVPLAILTSSRSPRDIEQARCFKVDAYIHKPSTLDDFLRVVGNAVADLLQPA